MSDVKQALKLAPFFALAHAAIGLWIVWDAINQRTDFGDDPRINPSPATERDRGGGPVKRFTRA